jgi:hypothetical protein
MTSITTRLVVATAAALLLGGALRTPVVAIDRPPEEERLERMTALMDTMHRSMHAMRDDMRHMAHMGPMHDRMERTMGMAEEMRTYIQQYREHPCPK